MSGNTRARRPTPARKPIGQPIVLVTTSSEFQNDHRLVDVALQALASEPVHVVATLPAGGPGSRAAAGNAHVERFVPHGPVLDRAVCAVTHGGMGATQKALGAACPFAPCRSAGTSSK